MTASIMMVTYNRLELTKRMLDNLFTNTTSPYRLIIVDNGSTDGTAEWLKQLKPASSFCQDYHSRFNEKNLGIATGRNRCLLVADHYQDDLLATVDNDVEFPKDW